MQWELDDRKNFSFAIVWKTRIYYNKISNKSMNEIVTILISMISMTEIYYRNN